MYLQHLFMVIIVQHVNKARYRILFLLEILLIKLMQKKRVNMLTMGINLMRNNNIVALIRQEHKEDYKQLKKVVE
jgi:hypothetical protein